MSTSGVNILNNDIIGISVSTQNKIGVTDITFGNKSEVIDPDLNPISVNYYGGSIVSN